ncbi:MAG: S24 family peptidase [Pyrinomonadaceae bacterium]|nr:S24 family peptidase [Pyrinomonadaceae bacterium]
MEAYKISPHGTKSVWMAASGSIAAGEPQEVEPLFEKINLGEFVTNGSDEVYMIRANGDSMEAEIKSGDWLIVNRNLQARNGDKILACLGSSYTVKIFSPNNNGLHLVSANGKYPPRQITRRDNFEIFGVVTHVLHSLKKI